MTLSVDIGYDHNEYAHQPHQTRNGPSRIRRRERRAEAWRLAAEATVSAEKAKATEVTEELEDEISVSEEIEATAKTEQVGENISDAEKVVTDEVCSDKEYNAKVNEFDDTEKHEFECWDPRNKWEIQDVYNHMGETFDQMFRVFNVSNEEQQYQLDVDEKVKESFQVKLEIRKSKHVHGFLGVLPFHTIKMELSI